MKNPAASKAVVRVNTLAVPRLVRNPLELLTRPPPSDFCSRTTPIIATTSIRWIRTTTVSISDTSYGLGGQEYSRCPVFALRISELEGSLHDPKNHFYRHKLWRQWREFNPGRSLRRPKTTPVGGVAVATGVTLPQYGRCAALPGRQ